MVQILTSEIFGAGPFFKALSILALYPKAGYANALVTSIFI